MMVDTGISKSNIGYLEFLKDIYEVSSACFTKTYIWGGFTIDIFEGRFLREHGDLDGFTENLLKVLDDMIAMFRDRGYDTKFHEDIHMLETRKGKLHASFNELEIDGSTAMWRHIGEMGTVYFPTDWLDRVPRDFYNTRVYTSGLEFEYALKLNPSMLNPEWRAREKDRAALDYLQEKVQMEGICSEYISSSMWSCNPYWEKKKGDKGMSDKVTKALAIFDAGFNCSQSVIGAFCEQYGLEEQLSLKLAGGFGGGMRCGEVCGAVTGAVMAIGLKYGQSSAEDKTSKENCNKVTLDFMEQYQKRNNTVLCRELLGYDVRDTEARKLFPGRQKEVCPKAIETAVLLLEELGI